MSEPPIPVVVNRTGGAAGRLGKRLGPAIEAAFAGAGLAIDLRLVRGDKVVETVRSVADAPLVVVGGGDGTLGCAAGVLAGSDTALGILPLGTRNHLAAQLGVPPALDAAARLIAERPTRRIDLGRVDDRVFVNNASIGLYPELVRRRDDSPAPKWLAAAPAALGALARLRHHRLRLTIDGEAQALATPLLFVGNNRYELNTGHLGSRAALDDGRLSVYAVASGRRLALVGLAVRALVGRVDPARDFAALREARALVVDGHARRIDVALDGEVARLAMPLRFRSDPGALVVVAPTA